MRMGIIPNLIFGIGVIFFIGRDTTIEQPKVGLGGAEMLGCGPRADGQKANPGNQF